jgi:phytoene desaturase
MLYLGIEGRDNHLGHHTIFLDEEYGKNLREIEDLHRLSESPSFYVQNACVTDPSMAPEGMSTLYVLVPVTHQHPNVDWSIECTRFRALTLARLAKVGIRDVERRIRFEHMITPADWDQSYEIHRGATFNSDASSPTSQSVRGPGGSLLSRRRDPPGKRSSGHF